MGVLMRLVVLSAAACFWVSWWLVGIAFAAERSQKPAVRDAIRSWDNWITWSFGVSAVLGSILALIAGVLVF